MWTSSSTVCLWYNYIYNSFWILFSILRIVFHIKSTSIYLLIPITCHIIVNFCQDPVGLFYQWSPSFPSVSEWSYRPWAGTIAISASHGFSSGCLMLLEAVLKKAPILPLTSAFLLSFDVSLCSCRIRTNYLIITMKIHILWNCRNSSTEIKWEESRITHH